MYTPVLSLYEYLELRHILYNFRGTHGDRISRIFDSMVYTKFAHLNNYVVVL